MTSDDITDTPFHLTGWMKLVMGSALTLLISSLVGLGIAIQSARDVKVELIGIHEDIKGLATNQSDIRSVREQVANQRAEIDRLNDMVTRLLERLQR